MHERSQWFEPFDYFLGSRRMARSLWKESRRALYDYTRSLFRIDEAADAFIGSMEASFSAFHFSDEPSLPRSNSPPGARDLIACCERLAEEIDGARAPRRQAAKIDAPACEAVVIGRSNLVGRHILEALWRANVGVCGLSRESQAQAEPLLDPRVKLFDCESFSVRDLAKAFRGAEFVINAAQFEPSDTWEDCERRVKATIEPLAKACLEAGVKRLVHIGSAAALFLGSPGTKVTGRTPLDPRSDQRAMFSRANALADLMLLTLHEECNLPVCILRPGIVVGKYGTPFHSGIGQFVGERHCIGWNCGVNPLPFVLASDVAEAALLACRKPGLEGRCYNLAGDVRLSAREYVALLAGALQRPLQFHPQSANWLWITEIGKWLVKRASGRKAWLPTLRDLRSRGFLSEFDCSDAKNDLGWTPVADREVFIREGLAVHAAPFGSR